MQNHPAKRLKAHFPTRGALWSYMRKHPDHTRYYQMAPFGPLTGIAYCCPLANYLRERLGAARVCAGSSFFVDSEEVAGPKWTQDFIAAVDRARRRSDKELTYADLLRDPAVLRALGRKS